jgi:hypothetical protein
MFSSGKNKKKTRTQRTKPRKASTRTMHHRWLRNYVPTSRQLAIAILCLFAFALTPQLYIPPMRRAKIAPYYEQTHNTFSFLFPFTVISLLATAIVSSLYASAQKYRTMYMCVFMVDYTYAPHRARRRTRTRNLSVRIMQWHVPLAISCCSLAYRVIFDLRSADLGCSTKRWYDFFMVGWVGSCGSDDVLEDLGRKIPGSWLGRW